MFGSIRPNALLQIGGWILLLLLPQMASSQSYNVIYVKTGTAQGDRFGHSVAIGGDMTWPSDGRAEFLVGAPYVDIDNVGNVGAAYVYSGANGNLLHQKNGRNIGPCDDVGDDRNNFFGWSIAGVGNVDGVDGPDFIIGAPRGITSSPLLFRYGYAFTYSGTTGQNLSTLCGPTNEYDRFGWSVAGVGDLNNDAKADVIIGAPTYQQYSLIDQGLAEIWAPTTGLGLFSKVGASAGDSLGFSVAGAGDINGMGKPDFIIGATRTNPGGRSNAGSAYVIAGEDFSQIYEIHGVAAGDEFGSAVAGIGDIYGNDGKSEFIVSAPFHDTLGMNNVGKVYVFNGATGQPIFILKGEAAVDLFGSSVAGTGDVNGDGKADFIVGAPRADTASLIDPGAVYVYSGADGSLLFRRYGNANYDYLGYSVSGGGDVNGDGKADFIIGVPQADPGGITNAGAVHVYGFFDATPPSVTVTDPNGGEYVSIPCPYYTITWTATDNVGVTGIEIRLDRTNNGDFEEQIALLANNPGSYDWDATGPASTTAKIKVIATDAAGNSGSDVSNNTFTIGGLCILKSAAALPTFNLDQNYPNPFNANTNISFSLDEVLRVELVVYNILGEKVRTLVSGERSAGSHDVPFDGRDDKGRTLSSGTYFYKLTAGERVVTKQMMLVK